MDSGDEFNISRAISTVDRDTNITVGPVFTVSPKNSSSPGPLYPDTQANTDVIVESLSNGQVVNLITDIIGDFTSVPLNSSNFNTVPPAAQAMSGTANPVTLSTPLDEAFDLAPFTIGTIDSFLHINPGANYVNDVFALVKDDVMIAFDRFEQVINVDNFSALFSVGDTVSQSGFNGIITGLNSELGFIRVRPFSYYGFDSTSLSHKGTSYNITSVERDYDSGKFGSNAKMRSKTLFATGRISEIKVLNSGFGYIDNTDVFLTNDAGEIQAKGRLSAQSQGITAGFWGGERSHLNGYKADGTYYDSRNKIHDSDFYQEYSYQIRSTVDIETYRDTLKKNVHLAGTRLFGSFIYEKKASLETKASLFVNKKEDPLIGGDPIVGPNQPGEAVRYTSDRTTLSVDSVNIRVDVTI